MLIVGKWRTFHWEATKLLLWLHHTKLLLWWRHHAEWLRVLLKVYVEWLSVRSCLLELLSLILSQPHSNVWSIIVEELFNFFSGAAVALGLDSFIRVFIIYKGHLVLLALEFSFLDTTFSDFSVSFEQVMNLNISDFWLEVFDKDVSFVSVLTSLLSLKSSFLSANMIADIKRLINIIKLDAAVQFIESSLSRFRSLEANEG
mmetsp:Transcript_77884/g.90917  ORF Transcript_77884/g.90917 Transcript_77884/m.90917 type:complete len:202 (-) Transcript_77884:758-1363(-)